VIWPADDSVPALPRAMPPNGVDHHYAPLAQTPFNDTTQLTDLRYTFEPLAKKT
jgi:hypothetical protein